MTPQYDVLKTFEGVKAGEYATNDMPNGILLHFIDLEVMAGNASGGTGTGGGRTFAETVDFIELRLGNKKQREYTGAELVALNARNGAAYDIVTTGTGATLKTFIRIYLNEIFRRDPFLARAFGWNLNDNPGVPGSGDLQIAIKFNAACTTPSVTGGYWYEPSNKSIGTIVKVRRVSQDAIGTSRDYSKILDLGDKAALLYSIHFMPTVGGTVRYVNKISLSYDGKDIVKPYLGYLQNRFRLQKAEMVPDVVAAPRFDVEFDALDPIQDALPLRMGANHNLYVEWDGAAAGNMAVLLQYAGLPE